MKKERDFDYETVSILINQDRGKGFHEREYSRKPELRRVVEMVSVKKGRMLDIGCGGGLVTECLPEYFPHVKIYGCDISLTAINLAKKYSNGKVSYKKMNKKLPYPTSYFDACVSLDVIEHVPDVEFFLKEVRRVLKKDGEFLSAIPCEGQPFTISWFFSKIGIGQNLTFKHVGHIHPEFTHKYIVKLFTDNDFEVVAKRYSERLPVQFLRYFLFLIPKEILELSIGKKNAVSYSDKGIRSKNSHKKVDVIMFFRIILDKIRIITKIIDDIDAERFRNFKFGAWKINILVVKK